MQFDNSPAPFVVSFHDVTHVYSKEIKQCLEMLDQLGVKGTSLLTIPEYHGNRLGEDEEFIKFLKERENHGDEIVLHGYLHKEHYRPSGLVRNIRRAIFTRGEGEFLGLTEDECRMFIRKGLDLLNKFDFTPIGFVAPAWLIEKRLFHVLLSEGILYTTRQTKIVDIENNMTIPSPTLVLRGSSYKMNKISRRVCDLRNQLINNDKVLRVAIHPVDIKHGALDWYRQLISTMLEQRPSATYRDLLNK